MKKYSSILIVLGAFCLPIISIAEATPFDINNNGLPDNTEAEVTLQSDFTLPAGEYSYNNLVVSNEAVLTLLSDLDSTDAFKGVKITANNISVLGDSKITADGKGYPSFTGPGSSGPDYYHNGASYGGVGINNSATSTYGSATTPKDLGSGSSNPGGGAIWIDVSNNFINDGLISANGMNSGSGGSIYIRTSSLSGVGGFKANGGGLFYTGYSAGPGGGGRIAIYYQDTTFTGNVEVNGGCGSYDGWSQTCAERGSAGLFNLNNNTLYVKSAWQFLTNDGPFDLKEIIVSSGAKIRSENNVSVKADEMLLDHNSEMRVFGGSTFLVKKITLNNISTLDMLGDGVLKTDELSLSDGSSVTTGVLKTLFIDVRNLNISSDSSISVDRKGHGFHSGLGVPTNYNSFYETYLDGASYGGVGDGNVPSSTYGSSTAPTDFGSGGDGYDPYGGGALRIISNGDFVNNGTVSANGSLTSSGGSIYITTKNLSGSGVFIAKGGNAYCPNICFRPGGGGRIAIYYENSTFSGEASALGGGCRFCWGGHGGAGTVVAQEIVHPTVVELSGTSVMFFPGVMGSRLYEAGDEKWASIWDSNHERLTLDEDGKSVNPIYTKDDTQSINDEAETGITDEVLGSNIYNSFINDLRDWKTERVINDYAFVPYDWRLSLEDIVTKGATTTGGVLNYDNEQNFSESYILKKLEELSATSSNITLIGHSNGGLVIKALVQKLKDTNNPLYYKIDKIIFVAVPQIGTPEAILNLLHGTSLGGGLVMENQRIRELSENMPMVYNLLPSNAYFTTLLPGFAENKVANFEDHSAFSEQISKYGFFVTNAIGMKNFILGSDGREKPAYNDTDMPSIGNPTLYQRAEAMHNVLDSWEPASTTKVIQIAGWGEETLAGIYYKRCRNYTLIGYHKCFEPRMVVDGDGTVVTPSALWMSTTSPNVERWWVDLNEYDTISNIERIHRDILEVSNLRYFLKKRLNNEIYSSTENIVVDNTLTFDLNGERLHYILHSPLTLGVTDSQGRYTGLDPVTREVREEIPSVNYLLIGGTQFLSVPSDLSGQVKLFGYEDGVFALDVSKQKGNDIVETTSFQGLFSTASTTVTLYINPTVASSTLEIDEDSDGEVDLTLIAKLNEVVVPPKYDWSGFLQPINDLDFYPDQKQSVFKGGSTVPVKFQLKDRFGNVVQASSSPLWLTPQMGSQMSTIVGESVYTTSATNGEEFKWDPVSQIYSYNWSTKGVSAGYWYKLSVKLDDGYVYSVVVGLR